SAPPGLGKGWWTWGLLRAMQDGGTFYGLRVRRPVRVSRFGRRVRPLKVLWCTEEGESFKRTARRFGVGAGLVEGRRRGPGPGRVRAGAAGRARGGAPGLRRRDLRHRARVVPPGREEPGGGQRGHARRPAGADGARPGRPLRPPRPQGRGRLRGGGLGDLRP